MKIFQRAGRFCTFGFRRCYLSVLLFAVGGISPADVSAASEVLHRVDAKVEVPAEGASVRMLDIGGRPVVEVMINGKGPFPFVLDTGATQTVIDPGLGEELSLPPGDNTRISELRIGEIKVTDLKADLLPVTAMFGKVDRPPRGVLSALAFPGYLLTLDYPGKKIGLRSGALPEADSRTVFSYGADEMLPIVPVKVAGRELKVHLDTGAPFALSLPTRYKDQLPLTAPAQEKGKARTHGGDYPIFAATVDGEIRIGDFILASRDINFTDVVPHPGAKPQGQLGYGALREFVVTLDSAKRRIEFASAKPPAEIQR